MAFVAIGRRTGAMLGVGRLHLMPNMSTAEYAVLVRSDMKGKGLGWLLMQMLIEYARLENIATIQGEVLADNTVMLSMCAELGFTVSESPDDANIRLVRLNIG